MLGLGLGLSSRSVAGGGGVAAAAIVISNSSVAEDAAVGTDIGTFSVVNGSGTYTFSITADPDNKFDTVGANDSILETTAALDWETATSHPVTIEADNGVDPPLVRVFTINVTNVFEDVTPNAFNFVDVNNADHNTIYTSNTIVISGLEPGAEVAATITAPDGGGYIKDGGSLETAATTAVNGTTFAMQIQSSGADDETVVIQLTVGGVSDTYAVSTPVTGGSFPDDETGASEFIIIF